MPAPRAQVPSDVARRLGITILPGQLNGKAGYWLNYGRARGSQWFPTERKALEDMEKYVHRRYQELAKDFGAFGKLERWVVGRLEFHPLDGEED